MGFELLKIHEVCILSLSFISFLLSLLPLPSPLPNRKAFQRVSGVKIGGTWSLCVAFLRSSFVTMSIGEFSSLWERSRWLSG